MTLDAWSVPICMLDSSNSYVRVDPQVTVGEGNVHAHFQRLLWTPRAIVDDAQARRPVMSLRQSQSWAGEHLHAHMNTSPSPVLRDWVLGSLRSASQSVENMIRVYFVSAGNVLSTCSLQVQFAIAVAGFVNSFAARATIVVIACGRNHHVRRNCVLENPYCSTV